MKNNRQSDAISEYTVLMSKLIGCSTDIKIYALKVYILSKIRTLDVKEIHEFLEELHKLDDLSFLALEREVTQFKENPEKISKRVQQKLHILSRILNLTSVGTEDIYQQLDSLVVKAQQIRTQIADVAKLNVTDSYNTDMAIEKIKDNEEQHLSATHVTAELIANRIIKSLDPSALEKCMDTSMINVGPLKKAAMFDALNEKFTHVKSYQAEGKMLRDFKVLYKQAFKKTKYDIIK